MVFPQLTAVTKQLCSETVETVDDMWLGCPSYLHRFGPVPDRDGIQAADRVTSLVNICTVPPHVVLRRGPWKQPQSRNSNTTSSNFGNNLREKQTRRRRWWHHCAEFWVVIMSWRLLTLEMWFHVALVLFANTMSIYVMLLLSEAPVAPPTGAQHCSSDRGRGCFSVISKSGDKLQAFYPGNSWHG